MLDPTLLAKADRFRADQVRARVHNPMPRPLWIGQTNQFWYRHEGPQGIIFTRVDAETGDRHPAFDHVAVAAAGSVGGEGNGGPGGAPSIDEEARRLSLERAVERAVEGRPEEFRKGDAGEKGGRKDERHRSGRRPERKRYRRR